MSRLLTDEEIDRQLRQLPGWSRAKSGASDTITATFEFDDFAGSVAFSNAVAEIAEEAQHHPDIDIRWNKVTLVLSTHSAGGLTQLDIELAHRISNESS